MYTLSEIIGTEQANRKKVHRRAKRAIALCLLACALMLIIQLVCAFITPEVTDEIPYLYLNIAIYCVDLIIPFGIIALIFKYLFKNSDNKLIKRACPQKPILYICGTLGIGYTINLLMNIFFAGFVEKYTLESDFLPKTTYGIILLYISNAVLPALLEEWAFRGVICKNLLPYGKKGAIIISSLLFGIMHIDPPRIIFTTMLGIMLAVCYEYTGSLTVPMLIHFTNNAISTTIAIFVDTSDINIVTGGQIIATLMIYTLIGCGIAAAVYYFRNGISPYKYDLCKAANIGYKLSASRYIASMFLNVAFIPLALLYALFYCIYFVF